MTTETTELTEYEFSQSTTAAMLRHSLNTSLKRAHMMVRDGSKDGKHGELQFSAGQGGLKGEFSIHRKFTFCMPLKGYKADVTGYIDTDNDTLTCDVELLRQTGNGWERVEEPDFTLTLGY